MTGVRFSGRAYSWRMVAPLVPLAVLSAVAVGGLALVIWPALLAAVVVVVRGRAAVVLTDAELVVRHGRRETVVPVEEVTGVRVVRTSPTRLVPVVERDGWPAVEVLGAQELTGQPSLLQPRSWEGRADAFARAVAERCGLERHDDPEPV